MSDFPGRTLVSNASTTVVVGMSGGVDSSVTAAILREAGYRVVGLFMRNWEETADDGACTAAQDYADVARVCEKLDIPYYSVDFVKEYRERVFASFLREYEAGRTPNPDILCNREIKFDAFFDKAREYGGDLLATGHYCRVGLPGDGGPEDGTAGGPGARARLLKGADPLKDQSYFLHAIDGAKLARVRFPIGELPKTEVRKIAATLDLATQAKKDSTGICFIGERDFRPFLQNYLRARAGEFRTLDGRIVGKHEGAPFYTLGQRRGLGLGGEGAPWFVVAKDVAKNIVYVERGEDHPALFADTLEATELTWISGAPPAGDFACRAKARYRQQDQACRVSLDTSESGVAIARVSFETPQRAITPGQSVVFYDGETCLGGGVIHRVGDSYYSRGLVVSEKAISTTPASTIAAEA